MDTSTEAVKVFCDDAHSKHDDIDMFMVALDMLTALAAERDALKAKNARLVEVLQKIAGKPVTWLEPAEIAKSAFNILAATEDATK